MDVNGFMNYFKGDNMIVNINNKYGIKIAECELKHHDIGIWNVINKNNIDDICIDLREEDNEEYTEVININVTNIMTPKKLNMIKSLASAWSKFETLRTEYDLSSSDDDKYALEIISIPRTYGFISIKEHQSYVQALGDFLEYDEQDGCYNNSNYTYEELDNFIRNLNGIYDI